MATDETRDDTREDPEEEQQLHSDEVTSVNRKRLRHYDSDFKLEVAEYAQKNSIHSTARKFAIDRKRVKDWMNKKEQLERLRNSVPRGAKRMRLEGAGRPLLRPDLDTELAEWIRLKRENKQLVSRRIISNQAIELFRGTDIKISNGWLGSFLRRHNFVLRRRTTTCQKAPENYAEAVANFVVRVEQMRKEKAYDHLYAMDETAVWFDCPDTRCIETRGAKEVTVVTTGHEKSRVTVCLTARSDGRKLLPYVLVKNKRPVKRIIDAFKGKLIIEWHGSTWMDDVSTEDYLRRVIGKKHLFGGERLLVWDAFASHKSASTTAVLKELNVDVAFIPGGCTKCSTRSSSRWGVREATFSHLAASDLLLALQAPDVSWNKPFKERIRHYYGLWIVNEDRREFTAAGNPRAPALEVVLEWIDRAWTELSVDMIRKSFKACALSTPTDGTGDDEIACFKPSGSIGTRGLDVLRAARQQLHTRDGRDDYEEAGLSDEEHEGRMGSPASITRGLPTSTSSARMRAFCSIDGLLVCRRERE